MSERRVEAPAKLNLALAVTGRRGDGFHTLYSVFVRLALHDDLAVTVGDDPAAADTVEVLGDLDAPIDDNLVSRAVADLRSAADVPLPALAFTLTKHIPTAAGLGGGSSDAAAALELALASWGARLHPAAKLGAAMRLGADVPFFAAGHDAALIHSVGEGMTSLPPIAPVAGIVLITPAQRLSTAAVFGELDRSDEAVPISAAADLVDELAGAMRAGLDGPGLARMATRLRDANDLWPPAARLAPGLVAARDSAEAVLSRPLLLTGSGPTLFAVYPSGDEAALAADELRRELPSVLADAVINATSTSGGP